MFEALILSAQLPLLSMIRVPIADIPEFLRDSDFFRSLSESEDADVSILAMCYKLDDSVNSTEDVVSLIHTVCFWGKPGLPSSLIVYVLGHLAVNWSAVFAPFQPHLPCLDPSYSSVSTAGAVLMQKAIRGGLVEIVSSLYRGGCRLPHKACWIAASVGERACLRYLVENDAPCDKTTCEVAAKYGHLNCLQYLHEHNVPWDNNTVVAAIENGHFACLQYAVQNGCDCWNRNCAVAAKYGHLDCLKFLVANGARLETMDCSYPARRGHLDCLAYLHEVCHCRLESYVYYDAALGNNMHCFQYAYEHGCKWDSDVAGWCAEGGNVVILRYACERGCPVTSTAMRIAAGRGHLAMLRCLYEFGARGNERVMIAAAECGSPECVAFLHDNACCPWSERVTAAAGKSGSLACLAYLHQHGCPWDWSTADNILRHGNIECLAYAAAHGCEQGSGAVPPEEYFSFACHAAQRICTVDYISSGSCKCTGLVAASARHDIFTS